MRALGLGLVLAITVGCRNEPPALNPLPVGQDYLWPLPFPSERVAKRSSLEDEILTKLCELGVSVVDTRLTIEPKALDSEGEFLPGLAEKLAQITKIADVRTPEVPRLGPKTACQVLRNPLLTVVDLNTTQVPSEAAELLAALPELRVLLLHPSTRVPVDVLAKLGKEKWLSRVAISVENITPTAMVSFLQAPQLEELTLYAPITPEVAEVLARAPKLRSLSLRGSGTPSAALVPLAGLVGLMDLALDGCPVTPEVLTALARCRTLESLSLHNTELNIACATELLRFARLYSLYLSGNPIGDEFAGVLSRSTTISILNICETKITDAGLLALAKIGTLVILSAYDLDLSDACLPALARHPRLRSFYGRTPRMTDSAWADFEIAKPYIIEGSNMGQQ